MKIELAGAIIELLPSGAVWIPAARALALADLHFEKGSFFARFGTLLPPYDSLATLERLETLVAHFHPDLVIAAGDSFHDQAAYARLPALLQTRLQALTQACPWHWLAGNHDPAPQLAGWHGNAVSLGVLTFRHQTAGPVASGGEISGHYHPKLRRRIGGRLFAGACFVQHKTRLILPAFGAFTGGLDIASPAFGAVMPAAGRQLYFPHGGKVFAL